MTRSVADSWDEALKEEDLMVAEYRQDGYHEVSCDESAWPPATDGLFDAEYDEAS